MSDLDLTALNPELKARYAEKIKDAVPQDHWLLSNIPNVDSRVKKLGLSYNQPVKLASGQGYTYNSDGSVFDFNTPVSLKLGNAVIQSFELVRSDRVSFGAISRSDNKEKAFTRALDLTMEDMITGTSSRLEANYLYGGTTLGVADSSANTNTTTTVVTFTAASWAGGIWSRNVNARVQFYKVSDGTAAATTNDFTVSNVDSVNYKLTITGTATTGIGELDTTLASGDCDIRFYGAKGVEGSGLQVISSNTGSLFGIDAAAAGNALWKGNTFSASSAPLTFRKLQSAIAIPKDKGLDGDVTVLVSTPTWADLVSDQAAARRYGDVKSKKMDNGAEALEFMSSNGTMNIVAHSMVKRGDAFIVPMDSLSRVGSSDITFGIPGSPDSEMLLRITGKAGYEAVIYSDNTLFCDAPSQTVYISGIVPNA